MRLVPRSTRYPKLQLFCTEDPGRLLYYGNTSRDGTYARTEAYCFVHMNYGLGTHNESDAYV